MPISRSFGLSFYLIYLTILSMGMYMLLYYSGCPDWIWILIAIAIVISIVTTLIKEFNMRKVVTVQGRDVTPESNGSWTIFYIIFQLVAIGLIFAALILAMFYSNISWWIWSVLLVALVLSVVSNTMTSFDGLVANIGFIIGLVSTVCFAIGITLLAIYSNSPWWVWLVITIALLFGLLSYIFYAFAVPNTLIVTESEQAIVCTNGCAGKDTVLVEDSQGMTIYTPESIAAYYQDEDIVRQLTTEDSLKYLNSPEFAQIASNREVFDYISQPDVVRYLMNKEYLTDPRVLEYINRPEVVEWANRPEVKKYFVDNNIMWPKEWVDSRQRAEGLVPMPYLVEDGPVPAVTVPSVPKVTVPASKVTVMSSTTPKPIPSIPVNVDVTPSFNNMFGVGNKEEVSVVTSIPSNPVFSGSIPSSPVFSNSIPSNPAFNTPIYTSQGYSNSATKQYFDIEKNVNGSIISEDDGSVCSLPPRKEVVGSVEVTNYPDEYVTDYIPVQRKVADGYSTVQEYYQERDKTYTEVVPTEGKAVLNSVIVERPSVQASINNDYLSSVVDLSPVPAREVINVDTLNSNTSSRKLYIPSTRQNSLY